MIIIFQVERILSLIFFCQMKKQLTEENLKSLQILRHEITEVIKLKLSELDSIEHKLDKDSFDLLKTIDL